jgi:hypothetical protein
VVAEEKRTIEEIDLCARNHAERSSMPDVVLRRLMCGCPR